MKKIKIAFILFIVIAIMGLTFVSGVRATLGEGGRYFVKSESGILKVITGVTHNFDNGYTTELTSGQLKALEKLGIEIEPVILYHILAKPSCNNNGVCEPEFGENPSCADCKNNDDEEPTPGERSCYPETQEPYGIKMVNGGSGGAGINVAVLDTGALTTHLDLDVKMCKDATKRNIKDGCSDINGHGTHVAGTIAANGGSDGLGIFGVAPETNLWVIKVCGPNGCWTDDIAAGIRHATDNGVNIISMSLGGDTESSLVRDAIDYATNNDVLVIAAAGNDGPADGSIDYPGANTKVVAAGAIDINKAVPDWSSRGVNDGDYIIEEKEVEFGAPGVSVESTYKDGCYAYGSGTSMATPHIAGLAAKFWQGNGLDTRTYLQSLAEDIWTLGDDPATGLGLPHL